MIAFIIIAATGLLGWLFAYALARAAARGDRHLENPYDKDVEDSLR
jgi:type IV secretory pathway TrbD component